MPDDLSYLAMIEHAVTACSIMAERPRRTACWRCIQFWISRHHVGKDWAEQWHGWAIADLLLTVSRKSNSHAARVAAQAKEAYQSVRHRPGMRNNMHV